MLGKKKSQEEQDLLLTALAADYRAAQLTSEDRAMLDYAAKLTKTPWAMKAADVETLRDAGFDDRGIHDICAITSYFAFVNRIADGLGVELEGIEALFGTIDFDPDYDYKEQRKRP